MDLLCQLCVWMFSIIPLPTCDQTNRIFESPLPAPTSLTMAKQTRAQQQTCMMLGQWCVPTLRYFSCAVSNEWACSTGSSLLLGTPTTFQLYSTKDID
ncbi:uncharacterized protein K441DRAFT_142534 [Cenococcum geophilum 1.58]|uniref:uncharacterized protein n=1 Tax=Cenococcum geophilum 1.58 TaxID=794803 RepID=UPI00358FF743|nr:hypothetical protein K441DRAFT_142534 [Cenococcum geophilum 1.58]